jgi:hypothetical protein
MVLVSSSIPSSVFRIPSPGPQPLSGLPLRIHVACSFVISIFAIIILSVLGLVFKSNHHEFVGGENDPPNGPEVAATVFIAVIIYAVGLAPLRTSGSSCIYTHKSLHRLHRLVCPYH